MPRYSDQTFAKGARLQRRVETIAADGEPVITWQTYARAWFSERVLTPSEFIAGETQLADALHVFTGHWIDGVRLGDRLVMDDGRVFGVLKAVDYDGTRSVILIWARDQQNAD